LVVALRVGDRLRFEDGLCQHGDQCVTSLQAVLKDAEAASALPTAKLCKALLRCFEHHTEACRDMAVSCLSSLLQADPDATLGLLPYVIPVLVERLQCDEVGLIVPHGLLLLISVGSSQGTCTVQCATSCTGVVSIGCMQAQLAMDAIARRQMSHALSPTSSFLPHNNTDTHLCHAAAAAVPLPLRAQ
jgi:hypothetical protein